MTEPPFGELSGRRLALVSFCFFFTFRQVLFGKQTVRL